MAKKLTFICLVLILAACTKEEIIVPNAYCSRVFDKYFQNPPGDTTLANRTYWLRLEHDTTWPNPTIPQVYFYVKQVPKSVYDTMLVAGQPYPPVYCH